jgi:drug/metabolite transporter (DMT)-like permease
MRVALTTLIALVAFAANSLLCRLALGGAHIDAAGFTAIRLIAGAAMLMLILRRRRTALAASGSWGSALALTIYAFAFSLAYVGLSAATGALLLFGAVQATMIGHALYRGERLAVIQQIGMAAAVAGLVALMLPGLAAPPPIATGLMLAAGIAWAAYSLRGHAAGDPTAVSAGNFRRAALLSLPLAMLSLIHRSADGTGIACAIASGAVASGLGYAVWYSVLPRLASTTAATVQLAVPVIAAVGGILLLGELPTLRLLLAGLAILGGIALVIGGRSTQARG